MYVSEIVSNLFQENFNSVESEVQIQAERRGSHVWQYAALKEPNPEMKQRNDKWAATKRYGTWIGELNKEQNSPN